MTSTTNQQHNRDSLLLSLHLPVIMVLGLQHTPVAISKAGAIASLPPLQGLQAEYSQAFNVPPAIVLTAHVQLSVSTAASRKHCAGLLF